MMIEDFENLPAIIQAVSLVGFGIATALAMAAVAKYFAKFQRCYGCNGVFKRKGMYFAGRITSFYTRPSDWFCTRKCFKSHRKRKK